MTENPYESPKEKCQPEVNRQDICENIIPKEKARATTLGCFVGGCLFTILIPFGLAIISSPPDAPLLPFAIIGLFCWGIILFPIGAIIGGTIEYFIRKYR